MIKKFISRLLGKGAAKGEAAKAVAATPTAAVAAPPIPRIPVGKRVEVPVSEHGINPDGLDERAV